MRFAGIAEKDEKNDVVARSGNAAEGTATLREAVGDAGWRVLMHNPVKRDRIGGSADVPRRPGSIRKGLEEAGVEGCCSTRSWPVSPTARSSKFTGAGHISAKAARALIPPLARGLVYSEACEEVGYDHAARAEVRLEDVRNPGGPQGGDRDAEAGPRDLIQEYGLPDYIHVELARDIGKSAEERDKITKGIEDRNKRGDKTREGLSEEILGRQASLEELIRYELWKEQNGRCLYTGE